MDFQRDLVKKLFTIILPLPFSFCSLSSISFSAFPLLLPIQLQGVCWFGFFIYCIQLNTVFTCMISNYTFQEVYYYISLIFSCLFPRFVPGPCCLDTQPPLPVYPKPVPAVINSSLSVQQRAGERKKTNSRVADMKSAPWKMVFFFSLFTKHWRTDLAIDGWCLTLSPHVTGRCVYGMLMMDAVLSLQNWPVLTPEYRYEHRGIGLCHVVSFS